MITWRLAVAALVGLGLGYGGGLLAPRWMDKGTRPGTIHLLALVTALCTGLLAAQHPLNAYFWHQLPFIPVLTVSAYVDLHERIIPDQVVLFGLGAGAVMQLVAPYPDKGWLGALGGMAVGFGVLLFLALLVKGGMGFGDVKLAAVLGLFLGIRWIGMGLILSFVAGGLAGGLLLLFRVVGRKSMIPFGPYLSLGSLITAIWGLQIWQWYTNF